MQARIEANDTLSSESLKSELANASQLSFAGNDISCSLHELVVKVLSVLLAWQRQLEFLLQQNDVDLTCESNSCKYYCNFATNQFY